MAHTPTSFLAPFVAIATVLSASASLRRHGGTSKTYLPSRPKSFFQLTILPIQLRLEAQLNEKDKEKMRASFASNDKAVCAFMSTWRQAKFLIFEVLAIVAPTRKAVA